MAKDDKGRGSGPGLGLTEEDRALLEQLRDGIGERLQIRGVSATRDAGSPQDTKRARLDRNQRQLEQAFDEAVARPAIARALDEAGYIPADLRDAASRGTWVRDVAPALMAIQAPTPADREAQRRAVVDQAVRAIADLNPEQRRSQDDRWVDDLERGVRASLADRRASNTRVAQRLVEWAEEAMSAVSQPAATAARTILIERAFEGEMEGQGRNGLDPALRAALGRAGMSQVATEAQSEAQPATVVTVSAEPNRLAAPDDAESIPARRQMADLAEVTGEPPDRREQAEPGLLARLRGRWAGKGEATSERAAPADDGEALPDALRRRYAVHISDDGRTIELFEPGAKSPAITLDARSITTAHNEGVVITDIVLLARDRGWQALKVAGTAEFKDAVWLEASKAGLAVQHEPSSAVRAAYAKWDQDRPANQIQQGAPSRASEPLRRPGDSLAQAFAEKSAEERLADPRLRNAQLELMIGIRTAEKELKRPISDMPEVARALTAAVREQLAQGRPFDAPFVKSDPPTRVPKPVVNPRIEADRIPAPRV